MVCGLVLAWEWPHEHWNLHRRQHLLRKKMFEGLVGMEECWTAALIAQWSGQVAKWVVVARQVARLWMVCAKLV